MVKNVPGCPMDDLDYKKVRDAKDKLGLSWYAFHLHCAELILCKQDNEVIVSDDRLDLVMVQDKNAFQL